MENLRRGEGERREKEREGDDPFPSNQRKPRISQPSVRLSARHKMHTRSYWVTLSFSKTCGIFGKRRGRGKPEFHEIQLSGLGLPGEIRAFYFTRRIMGP